MSLTSGRFTHSRLGYLAVASLFLMAAAPLPGCGDSQPATRTPAMAGKDGGPRPGGTGGSSTGSAGTGGSSGTAGSGGSGGGSVALTDAGLGGDVGIPQVDLAPPPAEGDAGLPEPDAPVAPPPPPPCVADMPCDVPGAAGGKGLCRNSVCAACNGNADDASCIRAYGPNTICAQSRCVVQNCANARSCPAGQLCESTARICQACTADAQCKADTAVYGMEFICLNGKCIDGDCLDSTQCADGKICGVPMANNCGNCANSAQCAMDPRYRDRVCVMGTCRKGDCLNSMQCNGMKEGLICGAMAPNNCGTCASDAQCMADAKYRMAGRTTCFVGEGADKGKCVSAACQAVNQRCPQNPATFCCQNGNQRACVAGDCCENAQCQGGQICVANKCTAAGMGCDGPMNNNLFVDPVRGIDTSTGSGRAGGVANRPDCAFRTLTAALASAARGVGNNGNITIVGQQGQMTELRTAGGSAADPAEALPIVIPANVNVRITTSGGAVLLKVARAGQPALRIQTPRFALEPANNARLIIDGTGVAGGPGIEVAVGSANTTIQNVTVQGTRDHAIQVAAGQVQLGPGVLATRAGVDNERRSGLHITGGSVQITGAAQRPSIFEANTGAGISVLQAGGLEIDGTVVNGQLDGTVVVRRNAAQGAQPAGIYLEQNAAANAVILDGLVVFGHANSAGIKVRGGSKLKLRGSLVLNNGTGILLSGIAGNQDFAGVDLGKAGDGGRNVLQSAVAAVRNDAGGICFADLAAAPPIAAISAQLNVFGGASCAVAEGGKVLRFDANCMGGIDVQIPAVPAGVQVDTTLCPPPAAPAPPAIGVPF